MFFYYAIAITFLILVIDGFFQHFTGHNILGYSKYTIRVSSFFGDEYILGSYLTRLSPLFFALFIVREKKTLNLFFFILLFLVSILIFLSGERAAFFLFILSSVFYFFISSYKYQRLLVILISLIVIISILVKDPKFSDRFYHSIVKDMTIENNNFSKIIIFTKMHDSIQNWIQNVS